jgi:hypothetical protein
LKLLHSSPYLDQITTEILKAFSQNLILGSFTNICWYIPNMVKFIQM